MSESSETLLVFIDATGVLQRTLVMPALNEEIAQPEATFEHTLRALSANKPLASKVIAVANSAWFASGLRVESVETTYSRLGANDFYNLVVGFDTRL